MKPKLEVTNLREVQKDFNKLLKALTPAEANKILRAGASLITREVRKQSPVATGNLKNAAKVKTLKARAGGQTAVVAAIDRKKAPHAHLVNAGSKPRFTKKGRYVGIMPANPFFDNAVQTTAEKALTKVIEGVKKKVEGAAK